MTVRLDLLEAARAALAEQALSAAVQERLRLAVDDATAQYWDQDEDDTEENAV